MSSVIKLEDVNNFTHKSFSGYTGPAGKFARSNIFFAPNGNGKTSLAKGLKDEFLKTFNPDSLRIYDKNFVATELLLEEDGNIKGVKADFGKKDVDLEKKIKKAEGEQLDIENEIKRLEEENRTLIVTTETAIEDVFKRRKGKASIAKKTHKDGVHEKVVQLWVDDYQTALKKFPKENYDEIDGEKNFNINLDVINGLKFEDLHTISSGDLVALGGIAGKTYKNVDIPSARIVSWLEEGVHIHESKDICEFCGSSIDIKDLSQKIEVYIKDEQSVDRKTLEAIKETLQLAYHAIKSITDSKDATLASLDKNEEAESALDSLLSSLPALADLGSSVGAKIEEMQKAVVIDTDTLSKLLQEAQRHIETLSSTKEVLKKHYEDKINRLEILVKGAIGFEIKNSTLISDNCTTHETNIKQSLEFGKQLSAKKEEIRKLRESKSDLAEFANYLNSIFEEIGINFKLVLSGKSYVIQHAISGVDLSIEDISEGERNLLALVYFYFEMLGSDQKNLKDTIELVIVDDPATSMDDENRFYILELVKSLIDNVNLQSFVLTHAWRDYCDLCYGKHEQQGVRKYEILKSGGQSSIELCVSPISPYKKLYKEVYDFSQKVVTDVSPDEALHMPNTMRRVLEEYIRFNFGIELATQGNYNQIAESLFEDNVTNISASKEADLRKLLSVCNILSHGTPQTRSVAEIHTSSRFLMNRFTAINKYHHDKMKQS